MRLLGTVTALIMASCAALGQPVREYPQFRNISGLAGSGYGVDREGYRSLSGPVAYSTPVAHTLGRGLVQIGGGTRSYTRRFEVVESRSNGTGFFTVGATIARWNVAGTFFVKSGALDQVYNFQTQYISDPGSKWAFSLGVQDIEGRGGAAGEALPEEDENSSQSVFGVVTYRWDTRSNPIYISAGFGTRRFRRLFASASYQVVQPLRVWLEQDGYGINFGVIGTARLGHGRRSSELSLTLGLVRNQSFVFTVGFGF